MVFWHHTYMVLLLAACFSQLAFARGNFSVSATEYNCSSNLICLGDAHIYSDSQNGTLSLVRAYTNGVPEGDGSSGGIAYYNKPVRFMDPSNGQAASFSTNFSSYQHVRVSSETNNGSYHGDGFTFVISANNSALGEGGYGFFGFYSLSGETLFKSVAIEFDSFQQSGPPIFDASANHVSFDFMKMRTNVSRDADDVQIFFFEGGFLYVWVDYEAEAQNLEVRISNFTSRPASPFLSSTVNLSQYLEEYMWVGFSAGHAGGWSYYYIGDWSFESYGILTESDPQPIPTLQKKSSKISVGSKIGISVGSIIGVAGLVGLSCVAFFLHKRRGSAANVSPSWWTVGSRFRSFEGDNVLLHIAGMGEGYRFGYEELKAATNGFDEKKKLGEGGFGNVYRGVLPRSNLAIAVKTLKQESEQGEKEFKAEVSIVSQLRHRHLIQLIGWCIKGSRYHIVYELMPYGSLDKYLFGPKVGNREKLSWPSRWNIIQGTADAVDYLHRGWNQQVTHRDIKPSNILLDDKWNAKLGDFGLARLADHQQIRSTTNVAGTLGYVAPEVSASRRFTDKSDVFAFGVVALEIASGRKCFAFHVDPDEIILVDWVWRCLIAGDLLKVVDSDLSEYDKGQMEALLLMGLLCSHPDPLARPSMRTVVQVLRGDGPVPPTPTENPGPVYDEKIWKNLISERL